MDVLQGKTVTIVGLGLMGGSLALALRSTGARLVGVEPDAETRRLALARNVVDAVSASLAAGVAGADLVRPGSRPQGERSCTRSAQHHSPLSWSI